MGFKEKLEELIAEYKASIWMVDMHSESPIVEFSFHENDKWNYVKFSNSSFDAVIMKAVDDNT